MSMVRLISSVCALTVFISYAVLPGKRQYPRIFILYISGLLIVYQMLGASYFYGNEGKNVYCAEDGVTASSFQTNKVCAIQGVGILWASTATGFWCIVTILNLHLQIVWSSTCLARYPWVLHMCCWTFPTIIAIFAIDLKAIEYVSRGICTITQDLEPLLVFVPLGFCAGVIWAIHTATTLWLWSKRLRLVFVRPLWPCSKRANSQQESREGNRMDSAVEEESGMMPPSSRPPSLFSEWSPTRSRPTSINTTTTLVANSNPGPKELAGVRTVQSRLLLFAGVILLFVFTYAMFYRKDVLSIQDAMKPSLFNGTDITGIDTIGLNITTTPLEDLAACVHQYLNPRASQKRLAEGENVYTVCMLKLAAVNRISLPPMWRRVLAELTISISGICLLSVLGWRLVPDWQEWWAEKQGFAYHTRRKLLRVLTSPLAPSSEDDDPPRRRGAGGGATNSSIPSPSLELSIFKTSPSHNPSSLVSASHSSKSSTTLNRSAFPTSSSIRSGGKSPASSILNNSNNHYPPSTASSGSNGRSGYYLRNHTLNSPSPPMPTFPTPAHYFVVEQNLQPPPQGLSRTYSNASQSQPLSKSMSEREAFGPNFKAW
ncbi:hypothetical protein PhCBS80983_g00752 [Powellomyces hirtus]|uniref:Frizzled/Smoothened 7TM domain-containing protein n=1 Tax=Powellomyces hirtus TaxID=109895 RepID=A0A507EEL9_9FUNG|nr:hypothetical protein PhCBS80983_g00752 [Powellomyces hirtus]